jgi:hypothetical protein
LQSKEGELPLWPLKNVAGKEIFAERQNLRPVERRLRKIGSNFPLSPKNITPPACTTIFALPWMECYSVGQSPKGPNRNLAEKRIAVRTEDHLLGFTTFGGTRPGAPVSLPIEWNELRALKSASEFTMAGTLNCLAKKKQAAEVNPSRSRVPKPDVLR